jgi:hypothetical protein
MQDRIERKRLKEGRELKKKLKMKKRGKSR